MKKCCANCRFFKYAPPSKDQPYPEYWCSQGEWDGFADEEELYADSDCDEYLIKEIETT